MKRIRTGNGTLPLAVVIVSIAAALALAGTPADTTADPAPAASELAIAAPAACVPTADTAAVFTPTAKAAGYCYSSNMECLLNCSCPYNWCKPLCGWNNCCRCLGIGC